MSLWWFSLLVMHPENLQLTPAFVGNTSHLVVFYFSALEAGDGRGGGAALPLLCGRNWGTQLGLSINPSIINNSAIKL